MTARLAPTARAREQARARSLARLRARLRRPEDGVSDYQLWTVRAVAAVELTLWPLAGVQGRLPDLSQLSRLTREEAAAGLIGCEPSELPERLDPEQLARLRLA